jgi:hypothetical protein
MYNKDIICSYHTQEIFLIYDNINDDEKEFISDTLYREELLTILDIKEYDELLINKSISELYEKIKDCKELKECMRIASSYFVTEDLEFGLMILFSYDYMYLTHICISEYLETGKISETNINKLKSVIIRI